jgi:hypothetical protein
LKIRPNLSRILKHFGNPFSLGMVSMVSINVHFLEIFSNNCVFFNDLIFFILFLVNVPATTSKSEPSKVFF